MKGLKNHAMDLLGYILTPILSRKLAVELMIFLVELATEGKLNIDT